MDPVTNSPYDLSLSEYGQRVAQGMKRRFCALSVDYDPPFFYVACAGGSYVVFTYLENGQVNADKAPLVGDHFVGLTRTWIGSELKAYCKLAVEQADTLFRNMFGTGVLMIEVFRGPKGYWNNLSVSPVSVVYDKTRHAWEVYTNIK